MPYMPTPEQFAELETLKSFKERENLIALWEEEAAAMATPSQEAGQQSVSVPEVTTTTQAAPPAPIVQEPTTVAPQAETSAQEEVKSVDYYLKLAKDREEEAKTWEKRKSDGDRYIGQLKEDLSKGQQALAASEARMNALEQTLKTLLERQATGQENEDEIDTSYPEISQKIKKSNAALETRLRQENEARLKAIEERNKQLEAEQTERNRKMFAQNHYNQVKMAHSDIDDFLDPQKLGPALVEWAKTRPVEILNAVNNALDYSPEYVADIISQFKDHTGYRAPKKPSLGDLAVRATSVPQIREPEPELDVFPPDFTEVDLDKLMRKLNNDMRGRSRNDFEAAMDTVIAKFERTLQKRNQA